LLAAAGLGAFSILSGGWDVAPILSGSMSPGFPVGGVAVAQREPVSQLALRDVIIFKNPDLPDIQMVHRIIQLKFNKTGQAIIRTQGDANTAPDPWTVRLGAKEVYVVQFTIPLLGYPGVYTNHALDLIVAGVILLLVVGGAVLGRDRSDEDDGTPAGPGPAGAPDVWPEYVGAPSTITDWSQPRSRIESAGRSREPWS
jgi:signal peptidase I